jgi:murein DD-endopeptidase MepM/ murein hydrolase activator NlpD
MRHAVLTLVIAALGSQAFAAKPRHRRHPKPTPHHAVKPGKKAVRPAGEYGVRKGDTAASIARAHGLTLGALMDLNPGVNLARLSLGQRLRVGEPLPALEALPETPILVAQGLQNLLPETPSQEVPGTLGPQSRLEQAMKASPASIAGLTQPVVTDAVAPPALPPFEPADPDRLDLLWPVETRTISSAWGPRMRTRVVRVKQASIKSSKGKKRRVRYRGSHRGLDLNAALGTDVYAAQDGVVVAVGRHRQYGNYVTVDHGNGVVTHYAHHRANFVQVGDIVRRGQKIAEVGRTGNATGPHLHFELRLSGEHRNPLPFLNDVEEIPAELVAQNALVKDGRR